MQKKRGSFQRKKRPGSRTMFRRKKICKFCVDKKDSVDYKDVERLGRFITERGKILPSRISGTCPGHQRILARAIRRARSIALVPYIANYK